jgi:hypothetical protein
VPKLPATERYAQARERYMNQANSANLAECIAILEEVMAQRGHHVSFEIELARRLVDRVRIPGASPDVAADARYADAVLQQASTRTDLSPAAFLELGIAYAVAYLATGQAALSDRAMQLYQLAAARQIDSDPAPYLEITALTNEIWSRTRDPGALDVAIGACTTTLSAVGSAGALSPRQHEDLLDLRALRLMDRFALTNRLEDLAQALDDRRRALAGAPTDSNNRAHLAFGLALCLETAAERLDRADLLEESCQMLTTEIERKPARGVAALLSRRGVAERLAYRHTRNRARVDQAVQDHRAALQAEPESKAAQALYQARLANALNERYTATSEEDDLEEAIRCADAARSFKSLPGPARGLCPSFSNLRAKAVTSKQPLRRTVTSSLYTAGPARPPMFRCSATLRT